MNDQKLKEVIQDRYGKIARGEQTFCCPSCGPTTTDQCLAVGYTEAELRLVPDLAILGVGCGNPTALADLKNGETVLDLGSGRRASTSSWRPKRSGSKAGSSAWT